MSTRRVIALLGQPIVNEDGAAGATVKPGHLVSGVTTIIPHGVAGGVAARTFALEREELGRGIDSTYGSESPDYASGDTVKVGSFAPGQRVLGWIASGVSVSEGDFLESAGDGTLRAYTNGVRVARALEAANVTSLTHLRVEVY